MALTLVQFLPVASLKRQLFSQYSQGSVAAFATQFNLDWAGSLPVGGAAVAIASKAGSALVAEIVIQPGMPAIELNPLDYIGAVNGVWTTYPATAMGRSVSDGATNTNTTVTSATAAFAAPADIGATIAGPGIPSGSTITAVGSGTSVTISAAATATATAQPLIITRTTSVYTPVVV